MKKFIITENEKGYIKSLYGLLNEQSYGYDLLRASEVEPKQPQQQPPIDVKLIEEVDSGINNNRINIQGFNILYFYCKKDIQLSFKIMGETNQFDTDFNIDYVNTEFKTNLWVVDKNINAKIISGLKYEPNNERYTIAIKPKINFNLEITQKNSKNKTPFILPIKNNKEVQNYSVNLTTIKQTNYTIRKLKSNEVPQINLPFNKEDFLTIPLSKQTSSGLKGMKKILVIIESPFDIFKIDFVQEIYDTKNIIKKDNKLFIRMLPIENNDITIFLSTQTLSIKYTDLSPNETNYFVIEPKK